MKSVDDAMEHRAVVIRRFTFLPLFGSVHSFVPSASPTKLATVFGALSSNNWMVKLPSLVVKCAYNIDMLSPASRRAALVKLDSSTSDDAPIIPVFQLDVFTDRLFGGNQLAVFLDGRGLSAETMQAIAREMNFSETTFILPPERSDTDVRVRIFTPGYEMPIAGHPTIGSTFALAPIGCHRAGDRERFVFGLGVGPTPVTLVWGNGDLSFAWMTQPLPAFCDPMPIAPARRRRSGCRRRPSRTPGCRCRWCRAACRSFSCR